jgi:hypothetical protein
MQFCRWVSHLSDSMAVTSQKAVTVILFTVRTSNLMLQCLFSAKKDVHVMANSELVTIP